MLLALISIHPDFTRLDRSTLVTLMVVHGTLPTEYPVVKGCKNRILCLLEVPREGELTCKLFHVNPRSFLEWKQVNGVYSVIFYDHQFIVEESDGDSVNISLTSKYLVHGPVKETITVACYVFHPDFKAFNQSTVVAIKINGSCKRRNSRLTEVLSEQTITKEKVKRHRYGSGLSNFDAFAKVCLLEQKSNEGDKVKGELKKLFSRKITIKNSDTLLRQRSFIQLLGIASNNKIPITHVKLVGGISSPPRRPSACLYLKSQLSVPVLRTLKEFSISFRFEVMSKEKIENILCYVSLCSLLEKLE
ncbi:hypothetical protein HOLleu_02181 [Holothuria leucospilota]|uniref:Uncharacterized protein n=1 Tax=Holothuria leucospilota TaxID=206669 RepID=A0A9Q1CRU7_HOLLE|nr:hypothetical protein HOLleu_02181 [Holothuria leucospilota]